MGLTKTQLARYQSIRNAIFASYATWKSWARFRKKARAQLYKINIVI